jgi:phenylacetate-CoA ligase
MQARFGRTYRETRDAIRRSQVDAEFTWNYRLSALRDVVGRAVRRSRHFGPVFENVYGASFDAQRIEPEQLTRLPVLTKTDIVTSPTNFLVCDTGYDVRTTSGSSGRPPAKLFLDQGRSVREMAFLHHIWSRIGYELGDGRAIICDYGGFFAVDDRTWQYDSALRELWLSPYNLSEAEMDRYLDLLGRYKVRFLYGVPSAVSVLAGHAERRGWHPNPELRGVLTASETLFAHQRKRISRSLGGIPILSFYGLSERVAIAGELVEEPDTYEFEPLYGLVELVDDAGQPVTRTGERGRIVCTGFFSRAMSLIRYDTGDRAELVEPADRGNCFRLRLRGIRSRWSQEYVVGRNGERISVVNLDLEHYYGVFSEYQYRQSAPGHVLLRVVPCSGVGRDEIERVVDAIRDRVRGVMKLDVDVVSALPAGLTGKRPFVDQRIPDFGTIS